MTVSTAEIKIREQEQDVEELKSFLSKSTRENVKRSIQLTLDASQEELVRLQKAEKQRLERLANNVPVGFTKKIDTYGWDQSEKFVKIYITSLKDVNTVKTEDVATNFTEKSFDLVVKNLNKVNYNLAINNLCFKIVPEDSYFKCKKEMIAVFLKKNDVGKEWPGITEKDLKEVEKKEASKPKTDPSADPQDGMMSMMKKMYDEGDDEMKRTISKSFMESREKQAKGMPDDGGMGGMGGMPGMPGMGGSGMPGMGGMGSMGGQGGAGGMPDLASMIGGMGGAPGAGGEGGAGGAGGMPDMSKLMSMMGGMGGAPGAEGGADGKPDMSKLMSMMGGLGSSAGGAGGAEGMPDMASMMASMGKK